MVARIRLLEHVQHCSTYEDGAVILALIKGAFDQEEKVEISFEGVLSVPSAFVNAALVQLLDTYSFEFIRANLNFTNTTRQVNDLIKRRFEFALKDNFQRSS